MTEYKRKPNTKCDVCSSLIYRRPGELKAKIKGVYCNQKCYGIAQRKETPCVMCGAPIMASANKKTCSRGCANKNRAGIKYTGRRLKDNVVTARLLKARIVTDRGSTCERCQFAVLDILQVHHKNRDRSNNTLSNLELLCPNCHAMEHYLKN